MKHQAMLSVLMAVSLSLMSATTLAKDAQKNEKENDFRVSNLMPEYRQVGWRDLMPKGWKPEPPSMEDALDDLYQTPNAPVVKALHNKKLRIPGYVLPVKYDGKKVKEFLLVPFVGACMHVPPPPENQMVYVTLDEAITISAMYDPVWVQGLMTTEKLDAGIATAGYHMKQAETEAYKFRN